MATSVAEQIAVIVKTRLGLISTTSGYETTTSGVKRPTQIATFRPEDYQIILTQGDITPNDEYSRPGNPPAQAWDMPFVIAAILRPSDESTTASDTLKNQFWADCVKALTNATPWHTFGGLAFNSKIGPVENYQSDDGSGSGFKLELMVQFRVDETNPYTARA